MTADEVRALVAPQLQACRDLDTVLDLTLFWSLMLSGTGQGNIQLMDWRSGYLRIVAQRGFDAAFAGRFGLISARDGTSCGRVIRDRDPVVIEDVLSDPDFAPHRDSATDSGFRAVQSLPLISTGNAFVGVLSTHFSVRHRPTAEESAAVSALAELAADAIIAHRARRACGPGDARLAHAKRIAETLVALNRSWAMLRRADRRIAK